MYHSFGCILIGTFKGTRGLRQWMKEPQSLWKEQTLSQTGKFSEEIFLNFPSNATFLNFKLH
jgi:hypothetical protein